MSDAIDTIRRTVAENDVVLFMKGTADQPQCGFSNQVVRILDHFGVEYIDVNVLADEDIRVSTEEAFDLTRRLARQGLFVGISSGANLAGALRVAGNASDAVLVVVFCDGGEKYLSERFWDEAPQGGAG